jgi:hypothetical protein
LVYIDGEQNRFGRMKMCHMLADTPQELKTMALQIGLSLRWFQAAASCPHFDVSKGKRELAVAAGAVQCDRRQDRGCHETGASDMAGGERSLGSVVRCRPIQDNWG